MMEDPLRKPGMFISFEGVDYSGKSTQIKRLTERLNTLGQPFILIREPGGTRISERIRDILLDLKNNEMTDVCELLLYSAARHQLVKQEILNALEVGKIVIADRFVDSTTAYQGYGRQLPMSFIRQLNMIATEGLLPEMTFFLDLRFEEMINRKKHRQGTDDRLESQGRIFYQRIREGYLEIAAQNSDRFRIIDATAPVDEIATRIWEFVANVLPLKSHKQK
jgi:dTMP kinase